jgi:predicted ATPase
MSRRDYLRRFISLIDALYYNHLNVIIEAEVELDELFNIDIEEGKSLVHDEEFAYTRTLSRLKEMQSKEYQEKSLTVKKKSIL